jgi:hypothetical protein
MSDARKGTASTPTLVSGEAHYQLTLDDLVWVDDGAPTHPPTEKSTPPER